MGNFVADADLSDRIKEIAILERRAPRCAPGQHDLQFHVTPVSCAKCGYDKAALDEMETAS